MKSKKSKLILLAVVLFLVILPFGMEYATSRPSFCGSCHIMGGYHTSWEQSKHRNVDCVDCHYAPGEQHTLAAKFNGLAQLFSYLATPGAGVRKRAHIDDASCMTSKCHPLVPDFTEKKINFTEKVSYVHQTHFDKKIEGQELHCATCHQHSSAKKHFEVRKEACFLCHFKNTKFNEGRGECSLCHEVTGKPLQRQFKESDADTGIKAITHSTLKAAGVSCESCHLELIRGNGDIKEEGCLDCHEVGEALEKIGDRKLMHQKHVAGQQADCHDCHEPIVHEEVDDLLEIARAECKSCHPDHHLYQKALLAGDVLEGVSKMPALMMDVRTNCRACHIEEGFDSKGQGLLRASAKACVACHTKKHDEMLNEWKESLKKELTYAEKTGKQAISAIEKAKGRVSEEELIDARELVTKGKHFIAIVEHGHGVHNKKYSIMLIDEALNAFEEVIDELEEQG